VPADYTNVHVDRCGHLPVAEVWRFITNGGIQHAASGKCLDEDTDHDDDGRNDHEVEVYNCNGVEWQKWDFEDGKIINRDTGRCLDIQNCADGCGRGTNVWTYNCDHNLPNQEWVFTPRY